MIDPDNLRHSHYRGPVLRQTLTDSEIYDLIAFGSPDDWQTVRNYALAHRMVFARIEAYVTSQLRNSLIVPQMRYNYIDWSIWCARSPRRR